MRSLLLTAVAATAVIAASPAAAQSISGSASGSVNYENNIDTSITTDVTYWKLVGLFGGAFVTGVVDVDSSAVAVNDVKQISGLNDVTYREENEINGENGYVNALFGPGWSEHGNNPGDGQQDGTLEGQIRVGFFAPIINTVDSFEVAGSGNLGVNLSAGYYNMQMNSAALASSSVRDSDGSSGWAEASATSLQFLGGSEQYGAPDVIEGSGDDPEIGGGANNFRDRNSVIGGTVTGDGNIGLNVAAGTFNQQANMMTMAVATDSALAEANSGLVQASVFNYVEQQDSTNITGGLTVTDSSGNIGVNMTTGVGNQQLNSLTIATSLAGTNDISTPGGDGGGDVDIDVD